MLSWVGSFTNIASGKTSREGGHNYEALVRKTPRKPIRVFLQDGANDLDNANGNWPLANQTLAKSLAFAGYDYRFDYGQGFHSTGPRPRDSAGFAAMVVARLARDASVAELPGLTRGPGGVTASTRPRRLLRVTATRVPRGRATHAPRATAEASPRARFPAVPSSSADTPCESRPAASPDTMP